MKVIQHSEKNICSRPEGLEGRLDEQDSSISKTKKSIRNTIGALGVAALSILTSPSAYAQQTKYIIPRMEVRVDCPGELSYTHTNLMEGATITVQDGCSITLNSPVKVFDSNGKNPLETDLIVLNENIKIHSINKNPMPSKTPRVFPRSISTNDASMIPGQEYKVSVLAERSSVEVLASTYFKVRVQASSAPARAEQWKVPTTEKTENKVQMPPAAVQPPHSTLAKAQPESTPASTAPTDSKKIQKRAIFTAGPVLGSRIYDQLQSNQKQSSTSETGYSGIAVRATAASPSYILEGAAWMTKDRVSNTATANSISKTSSTQFSGSAKTKIFGSETAGLILSGESNYFSQKQSVGGLRLATFNNGLPTSSELTLSGGAGAVFGSYAKNFIDAAIEFVHNRQEHGVQSTHLPDAVISSSTSSGYVLKISAAAELPGEHIIRGNYNNANLTSRLDDALVKSRNFSAELLYHLMNVGENSKLGVGVSAFNGNYRRAGASGNSYQVKQHGIKVSFEVAANKR